MRERHEQDTHKMNEKLEREVVTEEAQAVELLEADRERKLRELKDRHAAELAARSKDMSPEEVQQVLKNVVFFVVSNVVVYIGQYADLPMGDKSVETLCHIGVLKANFSPHLYNTTPSPLPNVGFQVSRICLFPLQH